MATMRATTPYGTPIGNSLQQSPEDALATFLGIDGNFVNLDKDPGYRDPSLELASLRGARQDELKGRIGADLATGDKGSALRDKSFLDLLTSDINSDPFTGAAPKAEAEKNRQLMTQAAQYQSPTNPIGQQMHAQENFQLRKSQLEHPTTPLFPSIGGMAGGVPGAGGVGGGSPQEQLASLPPEMQGVIKSILEYTYPVPTGSTAAKAFAPLLGLAKQIDPSFEPSAYENTQKLRNSLTSGPESDRLRSLNALAGHVTKLDQIRENLGNFNIGGKFTNYPVNELERLFHVGAAGHGAVPEFESTLGLVTQELARFLGGGHTSDELRRSLGGGISSNSGDEDIQGFIRGVLGLAKPQLDALRQKAGVRALQELIDKAVTPDTLAVLGYGNANAQ